MIAHADVSTDRPAPYMKQLCRHFGHRVAVEFDDERGSIAFESGTCAMRAHDGVLEMTLEAEGPEELARLEDVVGSHLERFGHGNLEVRWSRAAD